VTPQNERTDGYATLQVGRSGLPPVVLMAEHARQQGFYPGLCDVEPLNGASQPLVNGVLMRGDLHQGPDDAVVLIVVY
jgi:hypothetical protein